MGTVLVLLTLALISICGISLGLLFTKINLSFGLAISASVPFIVAFLFQVMLVFYLIPILPLVTWIVHTRRESIKKQSF
ncbi:hypothetical protein CEH05_16190 [Halobacillus halophilus]|uniref:hypothetical protein n=1 Tax=Halobacillus halophilus TaxID=1570 RepID=UPI0002DE4040|nr:hypothetical protein [Halobacillus halophilus]ASF40610.1 hypothetical protein CEH05_16190 [Halobacillus halophilus]